MTLLTPAQIDGLGEQGLARKITSQTEARAQGFCDTNCATSFGADRDSSLIYSAGAGYMTWVETARAWGECIYCRADLDVA